MYKERFSGSAKFIFAPKKKSSNDTLFVYGNIGIMKGENDRSWSEMCTKSFLMLSNHYHLSLSLCLPRRINTRTVLNAQFQNNYKICVKQFAITIIINAGGGGVAIIRSSSILLIVLLLLLRIFLSHSLALMVDNVINLWKGYLFDDCRLVFLSLLNLIFLCLFVCLF